MKATQLFCLVSLGILVLAIVLNIAVPIIQKKIERQAMKKAGAHEKIE